MKNSIVKGESFEFALDIINLYKRLCANNEQIIARQLLRCGTSIGANIEEALAGYSKKDFSSKMSIASKEARETAYWLRLIQKSELIDYPLDSLLIKANELIKILTSIVKTMQEKIKSTKNLRLETFKI